MRSHKMAMKFAEELAIVPEIMASRASCSGNMPERKRVNRRRLVLLCALASMAGFGWYYGFPLWEKRRQESYFANCSRAQQLGDWDELQRLSVQWTRWRPEAADGWIFQADAAQNKGDFASAVECLSSVPESSPKAFPAYIALATLQFGPATQPLDGVRTSERLLELDPRTTAAHRQLIEFYAMTLQREKLINQIRQAIDLSREPRSAYVYLFLVDTMRLADAVETNDNWLKAHPDTEVFLVARALQLPEPAPNVESTMGNKHEVIAKLFERFSNNVELLGYQVDLAIRQGNTSEVARLLLGAPSSVEKDSRFWRAKGWLHLSRAELSAAEQALQQALELHPLDLLARTWLTDLTRRQGDLENAQRLEALVRQARRLRERCTGDQSAENIAQEVLAELADYARLCGDKQMADALTRRLSDR
ncbi:MAG: tetratricopeptide (TPR) repeat protein [Planctomycetaceae bacterium]|jgi:tetratricopeptide (TPR) repeat protein